MDHKQVIAEAQTYVSTDMTINELAKHFKVSKRTIQLHLGRVDILGEELHKLVIVKKSANEIAGRKKGKKGNNYSKHTPEEVMKIAQVIIHDQLTYKEAEELFDIPSSTIHDLVHRSCIDDETKARLDLVAYANTIQKTTDQIEEHRR